MKHIKQIATLVILILTIGCNGTDKELKKEGEFTIHLTRSYSNETSPTSNESEKINTLRYFVCENEKVVIISKNLAGGEEVITIPETDVTRTSTIYVIANGELTGKMSTITVGSDETIFSSLETAQSGNNGQVEAIAMSTFASRGSIPIGSALTLRLQRNIARFDLKIKPNSGIEVVGVRIVGLATASSLFENGTTTSVNSATYVGNFTTPYTESVKGLLYAHPRVVGESAAVVEADVRFNGKLATLTAPLSEIQRNCVNTISIAVTPPDPNPDPDPDPSTGSISMEIITTDMEEGDSNSTQPGEKVTIKIDKAQSILDDGVSVSEDGKRLNLPYWGTSTTIALVAPTGTTLKSVDGSIDDFMITPVAGSETNYQISTSSNARAGSGKKAVLLNFTFPDNTLENNYRISVTIDNYAVFPIITIDGLDWMIHNAFSRNEIDYAKIPDVKDIREIYSDPAQWAKFTGKGCQWGPRAGIGANGTQYMVAAWEIQKYVQSDLIYANGDIIGGSKTKIWEGVSSPCPEGWRVPTYAEYQSIWPPQGTTLQENVPIEYNSQTGKKLTAVIETFGGNYPCHSHMGPSTANAKNMIIKSGTVELLFPIAGYRTPNGAFTNPDTGKSLYTGLGIGIGTEVYYWCSDRNNENYVAVGIADNVIQNNTTDRTPNMWYYQRCVRAPKQKSK